MTKFKNIAFFCLVKLDRLIANCERALFGFFQKTDASQKGRFTRAACADNDDNLAFIDMKVHAVKDFIFPEGFVNVFDLNHAASPLYFPMRFSNAFPKNSTMRLSPQ